GRPPDRATRETIVKREVRLHEAPNGNAGPSDAVTTSIPSLSRSLRRCTKSRSHVAGGVDRDAAVIESHIDIARRLFCVRAVRRIARGATVRCHEQRASHEREPRDEPSHREPPVPYGGA